MPKRLHTPMSGELPLFVSGPETSGPAYHTWRTVEQYPELPQAPLMDPEAPANDVNKRYFHIERALISLGKSSQRRGFSHAVKIEPYATDIWGEYKGLTPVVAEGAIKNIDKFENEAKKEFWKATGIITLIAANLITKEDAKERTRVMWDDFYFRFAGSANAERREEFKKVIKAHNKSVKNQAA